MKDKIKEGEQLLKKSWKEMVGAGKNMLEISALIEDAETTYGVIESHEISQIYSGKRPKYKA